MQEFLGPKSLVPRQQLKAVNSPRETEAQVSRMQWRLKPWVVFLEQ